MNKSIKLFHGTDPKSALNIMTDGIQINHPRKHDSGDFGWGFYLTDDKSRAKGMGGEAVLEITVNLKRFAYIEKPYFLENHQLTYPKNAVEELFWINAFDNAGNMTTIHAEDREKAAKTIRKVFIDAGYDGIQTGYKGETVVFNQIAVKKIEWIRE